MIDIMGSIYWLNEVIYNDGFRRYTALENKSTDSSKIYEVVRVIEGIPLFWEDHYLRLQSSLSGMGIALDYSSDAFVAVIKNVCVESNLVNCNIQIICYCDKTEKRLQDVLVFPKIFYYPVPAQYNEGVCVGMAQIERKTPNIKMIDLSYIETVKKYKEDGKYFEVILINKDDSITEGSKSNVFFIKGNTVYTSPAGSVLKGVTRKNLIACIEREGIQCIEKVIYKEEAMQMDAAFLSGTSLKALPIKRMAERVLGSADNEIVKTVIESFDKDIKEYIAERK